MEQRARYLLRDRDQIFGDDFVQQVRAMDIKQVLTAPRSPWQRAYVERVIGTIRRECLDHMTCSMSEACAGTFNHSWHIIIGTGSLGIGQRYSGAPTDPEAGVGADRSIPVLGGLHHRYERHAA